MKQGYVLEDGKTIKLLRYKIIDGEVGEGLTEGLDYRRRKDNISERTESDH